MASSVNCHPAGSLSPKQSPPTIWRRLIGWQCSLAQRFDALMPETFQVDGNRDFIDRLAPSHLRAGQVVYDVGGGKNPIIASRVKSELNLHVVGLDISARELAGAPSGTYDDFICADISRYSGKGDADLVICQALLEHVPDTRAALGGIASILKPGGRALIFVPSRNAVYASLNRVLPQKLKCRVLCMVYPEMSRDHGFPAYYSDCTPLRLDRAAAAQGLLPECRHLYFQSSYFRFCLPLFVLWRLWLLLFRLFAGAEAAETFAVVYRKRSATQEQSS